MKQALLSCMFVMACIAGFSQEGPVGRMIPGQKGLFFKRHTIEIRGFYGKWTAPDVVDGIAQSVTGDLSLGNTLGSFDITGGGVYGGSVILFPDNRLSIGADILVNANSTQYNYNSSGVANRSFDMKYTSVLGRIDYHYINLHHLKLYSGGALGLSWRNATSGNSTESKTGLAYQLTALGVSVGGKLAAWAEAGFGYRGALSAGVAVRF